MTYKKNDSLGHGCSFSSTRKSVLVTVWKGCC